MTGPASNNEFPFNEDFCTHLEYHLGETFANSDREDLKGFWCDGVSWDPFPISQLNKKSVNDTKRIVTKAWIGKDGQAEYEMTIIFGSDSQSAYAKEKSLIKCIPGSESMDWIEIDVSKNKIILYLK